MQILINSALRVLRIVDETQRASNGLTARSITDQEQAAIQTLWSQGKLVRDDVTDGIRAETDSETAAQKPLLLRLKGRFAAESVEVRAALLPLAGAVFVAVTNGDPVVAKAVIAGASNPESGGVSSDAFAALKTDLLAMFPA